MPSDIKDTRIFSVVVRCIGSRCSRCKPAYADIPAGLQVMVVNGKDLCVSCYQRMLADPDL